MVVEVLVLAAAPCDLSHDFATRLSALAPGASALVQVRREGSTLHIAIGTRSRTVPASGSCEEDVEVASVIAATWLHEPVPRSTTRPPPRRAAGVEEVAVAPPVQPAETASSEVPLPQLAPAASPEAQRLPEPELKALPEAAPPSPPPPPPWHRAELAAKAASGSDGVGLPIGLAPYACVRGSLGDRLAADLVLGLDAGRSWGADVELDFTSERSLRLAPGQVSWWRATLSGGPRFKLERGAWFFEPSVSLAASVVVARGDGFPVSDGGMAASAGVCTAMRSGRELGRRISAFVSAGACAFIPPIFSVSGVGAVRPSPVEAQLGLGVAWSAR
jgi:hypothetical protein